MSPPCARAPLDAVGYLADDALATALLLAVRMRQPILLEGEPGVGKTEAARALAAVLDTPLIRLQCYEDCPRPRPSTSGTIHGNYWPSGWPSPAESPCATPTCSPRTISCHCPLLAALRHPGPRPAVSLIDEVDRADDEFEAFLLELLADAAVTIP